MSTISSGTTLTTALVQTGDTTGDLVIKTNNGNTTAVTFNTAGAIGVGASPSYGSVGQYLQSAGNAAAATWASVPSTTPGGSTTQVQYNNAGAFGGDSGFVYTGGNVGIGTNSPAQKLDVASTTGNIAISVRSTFANASSSVYYGASRGWFVGADVGGGDGRFAWYDNTAGAERMRITSAGNVQLSTGGTSILNSSGNKILNQTGSVLQVVSTQITSPVTVSHSSSLAYIDVPGFTVTITPSSSSNKILILAMVSVASMTSSGDRTYIKLLRNSTDIAVGDAGSGRIQATAEQWFTDGTNTVNQCVNWLDSPATTSAVTYKFQCATNAGSGSSIFNRSQRSSALSQDQNVATQILALEIAA